MRSLRIVSFVLVVTGAPAQAELQRGYRCEIKTVAKNLWVAAFRNKTKLYDFRVGAAGVIAEMRDGLNGLKRMSGPPTDVGPEIDRVFQEVYWAYQYLPYPLPSTSQMPSEQSVKSWAVNTNQGGKASATPAQAFAPDNFNPTYSVTTNQTVWTKQFKAESPFYLENFLVVVPAQTRIQIVDEGVIRVSNSVLTGALWIKEGGVQFASGDVGKTPRGTWTQVRLVPGGWQKSFAGRGRLNSWLPFDKSFSQFALRLNPNRPSGNGGLIKGKDQFVDSSVLEHDDISTKISESSGFSAVYDPKRRRGVAVIYGRKDVSCRAKNPREEVCTSPRLGYTLHSMAADLVHPVVTLSLDFADMPMGSLIEKDYELYPFEGLMKEQVQKFATRARGLREPRIFAAGAELSRDQRQTYVELTKLGDRFVRNKDAPKPLIYKLGPLVKEER
jgi:hypothetical protein